MKQKSIAKSYDKIAHEYTQAHGYGEHAALNSLKKFIKLLPGKAKVLDVGCGGGQDSKFLTESGYTVFGIDVSKDMIKLAKNILQKQNLQLRMCYHYQLELTIMGFGAAVFPITFRLQNKTNFWRK